MGTLQCQVDHVGGNDRRVARCPQFRSHADRFIFINFLYLHTYICKYLPTYILAAVNANQLRALNPQSGSIFVEVYLCKACRFVGREGKPPQNPRWNRSIQHLFQACGIRLFVQLASTSQESIYMQICTQTWVQSEGVMPKITGQR